MTGHVHGRLGAVLLAITIAVPSTVWSRLSAATPPVADDPVIAQAPISGVSDACTDFRVGDLDSVFIEALAAAFGFILGGGVGAFIAYLITQDIDIADEGWVWADPQALASRLDQNPPDPSQKHHRYRSVSGFVIGSRVAYNDTPANHDSHDQNIDVLVDPGQAGLLSSVGSDSHGLEFGDENFAPDALELEWETGIDPDDEPDLRTGDGVNGIFRRWFWPSQGDRVWANGHWIFDCGHATTAAGESGPEQRYRTEIHPPRAVAAMRNQMRPLPGTGATPVPVTATDLFIHGRAGFVTEDLNCGMSIIIGDHGSTCGRSDPPPESEYKLTPIDTNFQFYVCLPPKPPAATFASAIEPGPLNTVLDATAATSVALVATSTAVEGAACAHTDERFEDLDDTWMARVTVPLGGTGVPADAVYARRIYAGWVFPAVNPATATADAPKRLRVTVDQMDLYNDEDSSIVTDNDGELTMFWANLNRATVREAVDPLLPPVLDREWIRLSDFTSGDANNMNDFGSGETAQFSGAVFEFYPRPAQNFSVRTTGYERDCYDMDDNYGNHKLRADMYYGCWIGIADGASNNNDRMPPGETTLDPWNLGTLPATADLTTTHYRLGLTVSGVPLVDEDRADLRVTKDCSSAGEVALPNQALTCSLTVANLGPGLPRNVVVTDTSTLGGSVTGVVVTATAFQVPNTPTAITRTCEVIAANQVRCVVGTIAVGSSVTIAIEITPQRHGILANTASVTTASVDPTASNDQAQDTIEVYLPVTVDVMPGGTPNVIALGKQGVVPVAILTTPDFNGADVDVATVCFGDAEDPSQRDCNEAHGAGHLVDVDKDRDRDLLLHYETPQTGIDPGDTKVCLIGRTTAGVGIYGCDDIRTESTLAALWRRNAGLAGTRSISAVGTAPRPDRHRLNLAAVHHALARVDRHTKPLSRARQREGRYGSIGAPASHRP